MAFFTDRILPVADGTNLLSPGREGRIFRPMIRLRVIRVRISMPMIRVRVICVRAFRTMIHVRILRS